MPLNLKRDHALLILVVLGAVAAALAGLEAHVPWVASLCSGFSGGCQETAQFTLLSVPVWAWGLGFYLFLFLFILRIPELLHWLVALGVGVELSLVWIMYSMQIVCVFCLVNLGVILLILLLSLRKDNFWQSAAVCLFSLLIFNTWLNAENRTIAREASPEKPRYAAEVRGKTLTFQELEFPLALRLLELEKEGYKLKKERLDNWVTEMLLQDEADRRNMTIQDLVRREVISKGVEVSEEEVTAYYLENRAKWSDWKGSEEQLKQQIHAHLKNQKAFQLASEYAWTLAGKNDVEIHLKEPQLPLVEVNIENSPGMGPTDAPVTVVEFSDYECPVCRKTHSVVNQIKEKYKGKIRWVFKDFPLRQHRWAAKAAEAVRCAGDQGKFWEYQDVIYATEKELNPEQLKAHAKALGLDGKNFSDCLDSGRHAGAIQKDREDGKAIGVTSTPTYIINGRYFPGAPSLERFIEMIDAELAHLTSP